MTLGRQSVLRIIVSFVIALALLLGGQRLWQAHAVQRPLAAALMTTSGVIDCEVSDTVVTVTVEPVTNLPETVEQVRFLVERYRPSAQLELRDGRDPGLSSVWTRLSFIAAEGLVTGRFVEMMERVESELADSGVSWCLEIDERFLYVTLRQGDAWLHEVMARPVTEGAD